VLFAGGDAAVLGRAHPLLEPIARAILHVGGHGDAARTKLVVNLMLGVGMEALAEALAFGEGAGLDRERLLDALEQTAVVAPAHRPKLANARTGEYEAAFTLALMHKDFGLVLAAAADAGIELPATAASAEACAAALETEGGDEDFSVVIRWLERRLAERRR
jgi:3-hydroxyisobutyrate dehydrogenase